MPRRKKGLENKDLLGIAKLPQSFELLSRRDKKLVIDIILQKNVTPIKMENAKRCPSIVKAIQDIELLKSQDFSAEIHRMHVLGQVYYEYAKQAELTPADRKIATDFYLKLMEMKMKFMAIQEKQGVNQTEEKPRYVLSQERMKDLEKSFAEFEEKYLKRRRN
jgi:hypothetical protein